MASDEDMNAMIDVANRYRVTIADAEAFLEEAGYFND